MKTTAILRRKLLPYQTIIIEWKYCLCYYTYMNENNKHQRKDSISNTHVGKKFETVIQEWFDRNNIKLSSQIKIAIGINAKKNHQFDLGNENILVECKSHRWPETDNVPSAKIKNWIDAMFCFFVAPKKFKKYFIVEMSYNQNRCQTLLEYFVEHYYHLIPSDVILIDFYTNNDGYIEIYAYDETEKRHVHKPFEKKFFLEI